MTTAPLSDAELVAFLHGELTVAERRTVVDRLRGDADARARLAALEQVETAVGEALGRADSPLARPRGRGALRPLLALAGVAVVAAVFALSHGTTDETQGRNERLELKVKVGSGGQLPLFLDGGLELHFRNLDTGKNRRPVRVCPFPLGQTMEQLRDELDKSTHVGTLRMALLPIVLTADITCPDGSVLHGRYAPDHGRAFDFREDTARLDVRLRDFEVDLGTPRPAFVGGPGERGWQDEKMWSYTHMKGTARWYPEAPGAYAVTLRVETPPTPDYMPWPTFDGPLVVKTTVPMAGHMTAWGEEHDGLQARLVWADGVADADATPFALQLRNTSGRDRRYNYVGTTIAKIPQPMHYTLVVDGVEWTQIDRVPVIIASEDLMWPQPTGTVRTFVQRPGYWSRDGKTLASLAGRHRVQVRFHFEPSFWNAADTSLWHGELLTPELEVEVPAPR